MRADKSFEAKVVVVDIVGIIPCILVSIFLQ